MTTRFRDVLALAVPPPAGVPVRELEEAVAKKEDLVLLLDSYRGYLEATLDFVGGGALRPDYVSRVQAAVSECQAVGPQNGPPLSFEDVLAVSATPAPEVSFDQVLGLPPKFGRLLALPAVQPPRPRPVLEILADLGELADESRALALDMLEELAGLKLDRADLEPFGCAQRLAEFQGFPLAGF